MDIFVGSIPFKLKEKELREMFEKFGEVESAGFVIDKRTRQNKGYGFVVMPDEKQALAAIAALNGTEVLNMVIKVSKSEGSKEGKGKAGERGKRGEKNEGVWTRKQYVKKKKINVIDKHSDDLNKDKKKKRGGVKLAKNFKVGKRKKR